MKKTNAMRILDGLKIQYETLEYEDNTYHALSKGAAHLTASKLNEDANCVFKTIVMQNESKEIFVFCQNATCEINLKKARNVSNSKEITPVKQEQLLALTGYVRGGCSPIGMKKKYRTFIDESVLLCDYVFISAGIRGQQIKIAPQDLVKACDATVCDLALEA